MGRDGRHLVNVVTGADGRPVRMEIPPARITRWVPRRKAEVVLAVRNGLLTLDEACSRYALSVEEFLSWEEALHKGGTSQLCMDRAHARHAH